MLLLSYLRHVSGEHDPKSQYIYVSSKSFWTQRVNMMAGDDMATAGDIDATGISLTSSSIPISEQ